MADAVASLEGRRLTWRQLTAPEPPRCAVDAHLWYGEHMAATVTSDRYVELKNEIHGVKGDLAEMEDRLVEHMDKRFDALAEDLKAIKDHLGISDGS